MRKIVWRMSNGLVGCDVTDEWPEEQFRNMWGLDEKITTEEFLDSNEADESSRDLVWEHVDHGYKLVEGE